MVHTAPVGALTRVRADTRRQEVSLFGAAGSAFPRPPRGPIFLLTLLVHVAVAAVLILVPLFEPEALVETGRDPLRALLYDPPPPPPPPLPKGSPVGGGRPAASPPPTPPVPAQAQPTFTTPLAASNPDDVGVTVEARGSPSGSDSGVAEGMEEGVEGGVVGGVPGGVVGGVVGGTGTGPVPVRDFDRPPRLLRQVRPKYPQEAFVKKVEGIVVLEIVIDETGRVVRARITRSEPLLDDAAVEAVRLWSFAPAMRRGRPVASVADVPVTFRIY